MLSQVTETHSLKLPKLVIFDLWQTLVDIEFGLFQSILDIMGVKIPLEKFIEDINSSEVFLTDGSIENVLPPFLLKFGATPEQISKILEIWKSAPPQARLYRFSESWVKDIKKMRIPVALLTNIDRFGYEHFISPNFLKLFDYRFLSFQEGIGKPNTECFLRVCSKFNVQPFDVVMVGNSDCDDILPAKSLGMRTVKVTERLNPDITTFLEAGLF